MPLPRPQAVTPEALHAAYALLLQQLEQPGDVYTVANVTPTRGYDMATITLASLGNTVGTLIADLKVKGLLR